MSKILSDITKKLSKKSLRVNHNKDTIVETGMVDVSKNTSHIDLALIDVVKWAPGWMTGAERLLLYTLIYSVRPRRYLEIGTFQGGSALIVEAAMKSADSDGTLTLVDPEPHIADEHWNILKRRSFLVEEYSPAALPKARQIAGGLFDFVLIDGDHSYEGVVRDGNGIIPFLTPGAHILFHDSFNPAVRRGIDEVVNDERNTITSLGTLTREVTYMESPDHVAVSWGGLLLAQFRPRS